MFERQLQGLGMQCSGALHNNTALGRRFWLTAGRALLNLREAHFEYLANVHIGLRTRLDPCSLIRVCELLPVRGCHLTVVFKVHFGADDDAGYVHYATEVDDLVVDDLDHVERLAGRDGVHEDVSMDAYGVFRPEEGILILTSGVNDLAVILGALVGNGFHECAFYGGVV